MKVEQEEFFGHLSQHQHDANHKHIVMPLTRCGSQIPVPPPSPVPTAKGSRSAANEPLREYLENTVQDLPELTLPDAHMPVAMRNPAVPAVIDYRMLKGGSVDTVVRSSAKEFGAFGICGHGISGQELRVMVNEARRIFEEDSHTLAHNKRNRHRDTIPCVHSRKGTMEFTAPKFFDDHKHRKFWIHIGNVASRLEGIVEQVTVALSEEFKERIEEMECVICLCRYPHDNVTEPNDTLWDHALRFYLPLEHCIFYVQSERGPLSFDADPHTIVVTVGKQLEEWSQGEFKCVRGEMIFMPGLESSQASFSIELKCSSSSLNYTPSKKFGSVVSLADQLLIILCLSFLYKFLYC